MRFWRSCSTLAAAFLIGGPALAQPAPSAPPPPVPETICAAADHRQLDFWIGEWTVTRTADGVAAGLSRIERILNGCVIRETWTGARRNYAGTSFNMFDRMDRRWKQTWVDNTGARTDYIGAFTDGAMVFEADRARPPARVRMTLRAQPDGSVRQVGEASTDGGATWQTEFDLTYRPARTP